MTLAPELLAEFEILSLYNLANTQEGLKVHQAAGSHAIAAARRLHAKGLISQPDGGYLTSLGLEAAEHAQGLLTILGQRQAA
ncbi:TIGR02647 family protein [Pseudomonas sp. NPDC007930]|uniref:TIGR02647 family protein n=1 Tax=Pseudomonas sp. NPDC007930 TaxID=3364417 RepID=UPI0036E02C48